jgi:anaerobic selenocysteine-containing dehydrogenase
VDVPPIGYDEHPLFELFNRQAQSNLFAKAILEDQPYPLRALILYASNALVTSPGSERLRRAAGKLSLLVSVDPFLTASGQLSDYVLPAATFAEGSPPQGMVEARHESRSDWEILTGLAAALGLERYFPWSTLEQALAAPSESYMEPQRTILAEGSGESTIPPRFPSASGKIELYSRTLEHFGYDPLPVWKAPTEHPGGNGDEFPLVLVTGARTREYINSQFRQIPSVRTKRPYPQAEVHPTAAAGAGLRDGDLVAVVSPHGRIVLRAKITSRVHPECVVVPSGWRGANANLLTDDRVLDPVTGFPALRSGICRLERQPAQTGPR